MICYLSIATCTRREAFPSIFSFIKLPLVSDPYSLLQCRIQTVEIVPLSFQQNKHRRGRRGDSHTQFPKKAQSCQVPPERCTSSLLWASPAGRCREGFPEEVAFAPGFGLDGIWTCGNKGGWCRLRLGLCGTERCLLAGAGGA